MADAIYNVTIRQGHSYTNVLRCEVPPIVRKPILAISCPYASAVIQTTEPHGLLDGWRTAIVNVDVPKEINALNADDIQDEEYYAATVVSPDVIELNEKNIADLKAYTQGGFIHYNTPMSLTGMTFRIRLKTRKGGTLLASNLVADGALNVLKLTVNTSLSTITLEIPAAASELLAGKTGWYDIEAVTSDSPAKVIPLVSGYVKVEKE